MRKRLFTALVTLLAFGCQEVEQPTTVLTQEQWKEVKRYILDEAPDPKYKVGANFQNEIEFIGFDVEEPLKAGEKTTFTWYWKALDDIEQNWKVFVHFDSNAGRFRQNLDHVPIKGMYETSRWKKGQIIKDVQEVTLKGNYPPGKATPYVGFFRGKTRMEIANDVPKTKEARPRVIGPTLVVRGSGKKKAAEKSSKPKYALRLVDGKQIEDLTLDGKFDEKVYSRISPLHLKPFGNARKLTTWVKAFMTEEHLVIAARMDDEHIWGTLEERDAETWKQEVLEFFVDTDGDGKDYMELQITPNGTIFDARFPTRLGTGEGSREDQIAAAKKWNAEGLKSATHVEGTLNDDGDKDEFWSVEMTIPLESIPGLGEESPKTNDEWAMNFYRFDRPKEGTTWAYAWSTLPRGDFHQVDKFGTARIMGKVDLDRPVVSPEMIKKMRKNIDLKVRPKPKAMKMPKKVPVPTAESDPTTKEENDKPE
jgi:hypothetical protein